MNNRNCDQCNRVLQKSPFDLCMYCGAKIPEKLRLSEQEKNQLRKEIQVRENMREQAQKKSAQKAAVDTFSNLEGVCGGID